MQQLSQHRARDQFQFPACVHAEAGGAYSWKELTIKPGGSGYDLAAGGMTGEPGRNPAYEVSGHRPKVPFVALLRRRLGDSPSGQVFEFERSATAPPAVDCIGTAGQPSPLVALPVVTAICVEGFPETAVTGSFGGAGSGQTSSEPPKIIVEKRVLHLPDGAFLEDPVCEENPTGCCPEEPDPPSVPGGGGGGDTIWVSCCQHAVSRVMAVHLDALNGDAGCLDGWEETLGLDEGPPVCWSIGAGLLVCVGGEPGVQSPEVSLCCNDGSWQITTSLGTAEGAPIGTCPGLPNTSNLYRIFRGDFTAYGGGDDVQFRLRFWQVFPS